MRTDTLSLFLFCGLALLACKTKGDTASSDSDSASDTDTGEVDSGDSGDSGDSSDSGDTGDTGDTDTGDSGDTTDTEADCWVEWDDGTCYDCDLPTAAGTDSLKFLNQCSDVDYAVFDNATRIPASTWVPGTALPEVP